VEGFANFGKLAAIVVVAAIAGLLVYRWLQRASGAGRT
jgi:hypothetical protein